MNKIFNYCILSLLSVLTLTLGSCTEEYDYVMQKAKGQQVYFSNTLATTVNLSRDGEHFIVQINRMATEEELTVNLTATDESGALTVPSTVTFEAGKSEANITIDYDPAQIEFDTNYEVTVSIADADYTTPYGDSSYTFDIYLAAPYTSLGTGKYIDPYVMTTPVDVEILQNDITPTRFRVSAPYKALAMNANGGKVPASMGEYLEFDLLKPGETLNGVTITLNDLVYFSPYTTGADILGQGGVCTLMHPAHFPSLNNEEAWTGNKVAEWQANGLPGVVQIAPLYAYGTSGYQINWVNTIYFPGYELPKDYSVDVTYTGAFASADGSSYVYGNVTMGADVDEVKVAVVEGDDVESALDMVELGAVETTTVTESGDIRIPCMYSGPCTLVALAYEEGNDELLNYAYTTFNFGVGASEWKSLGTGLYTDYIVVNNFSPDGVNPFEPIQYKVEVQENTNTPGVYRVVKPYAPDVYGYGDGFGYDESLSYNIVINASDPDAVYIQTQPTGIDLGAQYGGMLYMLTYGGMKLDSGVDFETAKAQGMINGTLKNGVISFDAGELFYTTAADLSDPQGLIYYVNKDNAVSILTLPSAVTEQAMAKAAKSVRAVKSMKLAKATNKNTKKVSRANNGKKFKAVKQYTLNKDVKLIRK